MINRIKLLGIFLVCLVGGIYASLRMFYTIVVNPSKAWVMSVAFDQLANAATGGDPDETISSRAYRASLNQEKWGCVLCKILDKFDKNHCLKSLGK